MDKTNTVIGRTSVQKRQENQKGLIKLMLEDIQTALHRDPAARNGFEVASLYAGLHAIWFHRLNHWLWHHRVYWLARALAQLSRALTGIEIHPGAQIGQRFFIDHGMGVVIGETARIGDDVTLYHGVTLGGVSSEPIKRHPTIKEGVVVGAGAKILGDITIGAYSRIGANAVVVKDVPAQSVVVGVPGQIIKRRHEFQAQRADLEHSNMPDAVVESLCGMLRRLEELEKQLNMPQRQSARIHLEKDGCWEYEEGADFMI